MSTATIDVTTSAVTPRAPKLEARGLYKQFQRGANQTYALSNVNLQIEPGEFVAVLGASGCGKTTLLRIVDGL